MAGHALAIADAFPDSTIIGVEPEGANDFQQSLARGKRCEIQRPRSICDGLLSYSVGERNWPILSERVSACDTVPDDDTRGAMRWLYEHHGVHAEPSGVISLAALLRRKATFQDEPAAAGDIVLVLSGRNIDLPAWNV